LNYNNFLVISRRAILASCLAVVPGCRPRRGSGFPGYAFVAIEESQALAVVDLTSFTLVKHIPLGAPPTAVVAHPGRGAVYALTPLAGTLHEIDLTRLAVRRKLAVARAATSMRLAHDGGALWVLCGDPPRLARVLLERFQAGANIPLPALPVDFDLSRDGRFSAVSFGAAGLVCFVDLQAGRAREPVRAGDDIGTVRFRLPDGKHLLAADLGRRLVAILEAPSGKVITNLPVAVKPEHFCMKPDGGEVFITGEGMDAVIILDPYRTQVSETLLAGRAPAAMAISNSPQYLFVTNPPSGDVTIFDVDTRRVIAVVAVGSEPAYVTMTPDPDGQYALILNRRSGNMAVIRIAAIVPGRARRAALFTTIPLGSKPVSAAILGV
jgi:YVTN family beta-propeller protein